MLRILIAFIVFQLGPVYGQDQDIRKFNFDSGPDIEDINPKILTPLKKYFNELKEEAVIDEAYSVDLELGDLSFNPFGKLNHLPEKEMKCNAVFCKDIELQKKLNSELQNGRLILVADPWTSFNGLAIDVNQPTVKSFFKKIAPNGNAQKSMLIISGKMTADVLHHELTHASDDENAELIKQLEEINDLLGPNEIECEKTIRSYIYETRAYNAQEQYLMSELRTTEYKLKDEDFETSIELVQKEKFLDEQLTVLGIKKNVYSKRLNQSLDKASIKEDDLSKIRDLISKSLTVPRAKD